MFEEGPERFGRIGPADLLAGILGSGLVPNGDFQDALAQPDRLCGHLGAKLESMALQVHPLEQITKQLNKLVNVIKIVEQDDDNSVARELTLIKVRTDAATRGQVIEAVNLFRAKVVDVSTESLTIEATGTPAKLEAFLRVLEPYGIRELVQSGVVSLSRGPRGIGVK